MANQINPYVKAENCTDIIDCKCGIEICNTQIDRLSAQGKSITAYCKRLYKLHEKLRKFIAEQQTTDQP